MRVAACLDVSSQSNFGSNGVPSRAPVTPSSNGHDSIVPLHHLIKFNDS